MRKMKIWLKQRMIPYGVLYGEVEDELVEEEEEVGEKKNEDLFLKIQFKLHVIYKLKIFHFSSI